MLTNPKDQDLAGHAMRKFHLVSSLTFLKSTRTSKKPSPSLFPIGKHKSKFLTSLCSLFFLRKELEALLSLLCQTHGSTHPKKDKAPPQSPFPLSFLDCSRRFSSYSFSLFFFLLLLFLSAAPLSPTALPFSLKPYISL